MLGVFEVFELFNVFYELITVTKADTDTRVNVDKSAYGMQTIPCGMHQGCVNQL